MVMIGDDIESDIGGAKNAGISGILVKTGKFRLFYRNYFQYVEGYIGRRGTSLY